LSVEKRKKREKLKNGKWKKFRKGKKKLIKVGINIK